jgi:hypothetical protein
VTVAVVVVKAIAEMATPTLPVTINKRRRAATEVPRPIRVSFSIRLPRLPAVNRVVATVGAVVDISAVPTDPLVTLGTDAYWDVVDIK